MEVGYFKVKNPESDEHAKHVFQSMVEVVGIEDMSNVVFDNSHKAGDRIFVFNEESKINELQKVFKQNGILLEFEIQTSNFLYQRKLHKVFDDPYHRDILNEFLIENLSVDTILDKISSDGLQSLNEIDHYILKTKNRNL